jgi:hypothetical protein
MPYEAYSRLIQLITSETDTAKLMQSTITGRTDSEFQTYPSNGDLSLEHITNGWQLRQFTSRALNLNFRDLFLSQHAISPIGVWYDKTNDYFVLEDIEYFFKDEAFPVHLGSVKDLKRTPAKEFYYNTLTTGYPKTDYEEYKGVNEFNVETDHQIFVETKSKKNIRSPYRQETAGVFFARNKNIETFASEDTKYDSYVFINTVNSSYEVIQGGLSNLAGFEGIEQYYNCTKTPRQNAIRHGKFSTEPALYKDASDDIQFTKSSKDTEITYTDPTQGINVSEFDDIPQIALANKLIEPEFYECEIEYTKELRDELKIDPHRYFQMYDINGEEIITYLWSLEGNPYKGTGKYKGIKANTARL